jgi:hypothetical protein
LARLARYITDPILDAILDAIFPDNIFFNDGTFLKPTDNFFDAILLAAIGGGVGNT